MSQRAMKYLNDNRIIYRKYSEDQPTKEYDWGWYYEEGTYGYYSLFSSKAKINTLRSLKWHLLTLWWLNPGMDITKFNALAIHICNKHNGFTTFDISNLMLNNIIEYVSLQDLEKPPNNKLRKVVFKDGTGLSTIEKLSIVGTVIGRKNVANEEAIYQCMLDLNDAGNRITIANIAKILNCSSRTIHRNMSQQLRKEKHLLNIENEKI